MISKKYWALSIVLLLAALAYTSVNYVRYTNFLAAFATLPFEIKLSEFYSRFLRWPATSAEYIAFVQGDEKYSRTLARTGCYLKYDSLNEELILYSGGFDRDDDNLARIYNPADVSFPSSLFQDGDVRIQTVRVSDFLPLLSNRFVVLQHDEPDTALNNLAKRLWNIAKCCADTVEDRRQFVVPAGESLERGQTWFQLRKTKGVTTLQIYSTLDGSLTQKLENGF